MSNKTSVKSTALEQRVSLGQDGLGPWLMQIITRYGLLLLCIALVIVFSLTTPSFASMLTVQAILSSKAKIALLALAATIPMIVGKNRPERRFRYRAVAHPGDHLAGGIWLLLADGGADRAGHFRAIRPA